ncbi:Ff.00g011230.m01.CDS01 [Fusarium sp. VM40]|nr:Ff.00g011230.m01.CDS01 [Fusarium sp. VM40]
MPLRVAHEKSRHGCTRCKQRRVKCNELAPCQNCVRRHEDCSLVQDGYIRQPPRAQSTSPSSVNSTFSPHPTTGTSLLGQPKEAIWGEDLFLMAHFVSSTARTISPRPEISQLWQTVIPEEAITCPFLVHGMLAFSAMHLASLRPSQREHYEQCCRRHQNEAIPEYRRAIQNIKVEMSGQVFAMASLLILLGLASVSDNALSKENGSSENKPTVADIVSIFTAVKGLDAILKHGTITRHDIINSRHRVVLTGHTIVDAQTFDLPADIQLRYQELTTECLDSTGDESAQKACIEAIDLLRGIHRELLFLVSRPGYNADIDLAPGYLVKWFASVSPEFITMLRREESAALIILSDFFSLLGLIENRWYLKNAASNALSAIQLVIDARGLHWLESNRNKK